MTQICIGSAQFGQNYGITNATGKPPLDEVRKMLHLASNSGIQFLDTAQAYGNAEMILGSAITAESKFKIISKLPAQHAQSFTKEDQHNWRVGFDRSLKQLKQSSIDSFLLHASSDLLKPGSEYLLEWLLELKSTDKVKRIGVSIYESSDLDDIDLSEIDIVQLPFSIYDQRALTSGLIKTLSSLQIAIHTRSTFLQGLILQPPILWPEWMPYRLIKLHSELEFLAHKESMNFLELAVQFIKSFDAFEACVFGLCDYLQLKSLINTWSLPPLGTINWTAFAIENEPMVDPRNWP